MEKPEFGEWRVERLLGSGAFGEVFLLSNKNTGQMMALKKIQLDSPFAKGGDWQKEMEIIKRLKHPGKWNLFCFGVSTSSGPSSPLQA